jgi:UDP-GlcNAc3NAcA epimerase
MNLKIARILGTRPQFMQAPVVHAALLARGLDEELVHTGQHYDAGMSEVFFEELGLPNPVVNLRVGSHSQGVATGRMMSVIEEYLQHAKPAAVLVDGDTNSTMAAALAAVKMHIPVFHIEAGLRDFDRKRPEEINRIVTDHVSSLNFAPIPRAFDNLVKEGRVGTARLTGDVLCDCFVANSSRADSSVVKTHALEVGGYHVMTLHRPENTDLEQYERFCDIIDAIGQSGKPVIFPVHPRTRKIIAKRTRDKGMPENIIMIDPVSYLQMLGLLKDADCIFTDSGGLPREAAWMGKRVVMLFRVDTWHDLVLNKWAQIGKTDTASILKAFDAATPADSAVIEFYGGGRAAEVIADHVDTFIRNGGPL